MDFMDQEEIDARLGDMMGFTTFGMQPEAKKRKTSDDNPVTATGSNAQPIGSRSNQNGMHQHPLTHNPAQQPPQVTAEIMSSVASPSAEQQPKNAFPTGVPMEIFDKLTWKELEAYRKGVKKDNGDLAWFLPSFIEDPWAKLEKEKGGNEGGPAS
jgi:hypothetical protein